MRELHLGPMLRQLRGHRAAAMLVTLQLAVGAAVALVAGQVASYMANGLENGDGMAERDLTLVSVQLPGAFAETARAAAMREDLLATVRATPGIVAATIVDAPPLTLLERGPDELYAPGHDDGALQFYDYVSGADGARALGLTLVAGRDLRADDLGRDVAPAIVAASIAAAMFGDGDPVGRRFHSRAHGPAVVIGVVADLSFSPSGGMLAQRGLIYGEVSAAGARTLIVARSEPGRADAVRADLRTRIRPVAGSVLTVTDILETRRLTSASLRAAIGTVGLIVATILVVVLLGSVALTYTLVASRGREIGMRRALGATRADVVGHFVTENVLFTTTGLALGFGLFELIVPAMSSAQKGFSVSWPIAIGTLVGMAALNVAATLVPAWAAARVSPTAASRAQEQPWPRS